MQFKAQARFGSITGLPRDDFVNTFAFVGAGLSNATTAEAAADMVADFYLNPGPSQSSGIQALFTSEVMTGEFEVSVYDWTDPEPRAPLFQQTYVMPNINNTAPYPEEVAICLSYFAEAVSGVPQARRRGRIYLGPVVASTGTQVGSEGPVRPNAGAVGIILGAAHNLAAAGDAELAWAVHSRVNNAFYRIVGGWVDNSFDTQRRRGQDPTSRSFFPVV